MVRSSKEKILFISPTVPRPDMNSGDLRLCSILEILANEYEITFLSITYRPGDDAYVRLLEQSGLSVRVEPFSLWNLLKSNRFKVAVLEFYYTAEHYLDRIKILQPECRVVVDSVDVHYLRLRLKYNMTKDDTDQTVYLETSERELNVYRRADAVITVTQDDAEALLSEYPDIVCEVVPNIHEICLSHAPPDRDTLIFVGGFSHDPNVDAVIHFCQDILPLICHDKPAIKFTIVGSNPPDQIRNFENENIRVTGHVPTTSTYLHRSHVSVAPLRFGAGMKGKIGEAMAHGVPVVTTAVGAQGMGLTDRENVMIADSPQCFADAVLELLNDSCLYEKIRKNAVQIIDQNYTPKQVARAMITALERICKKPEKRMGLHEKIAFFNGYITRKIKTRLFSS